MSQKYTLVAYRPGDYTTELLDELLIEENLSREAVIARVAELRLQDDPSLPAWDTIRVFGPSLESWALDQDIAERMAPTLEERRKRKEEEDRLWAEAQAKETDRVQKLMDERVGSMLKELPIAGE